jgi:hypothetical protein
METKPQGVEKGSVVVGAMNSDLSQGVRYSSEGPVLSDLLKGEPSLMSEYPREIFRFFVDFKAIYDLKLVPGKVF